VRISELEDETRRSLEIGVFRAGAPDCLAVFTSAGKRAPLRLLTFKASRVPNTFVFIDKVLGGANGGGGK
jgi:hypothetical protein